MIGTLCPTHFNLLEQCAMVEGGKKGTGLVKFILPFEIILTLCVCAMLPIVYRTTSNSLSKIHTCLPNLLAGEVLWVL